MAIESSIPILLGSPEDDSITDPKILVDYIIKRKGIEREELPDRYVMSFQYTGALDLLKDRYDVSLIDVNPDYPIYVFEHGGFRIGFRYLGIGGPLSGLVLEDTIAWGGRYFVYFGGVGVLLRDIDRWMIIIPDKAIRDEGTSYHYMEPSLYSYPSKRLLDLLMDVLSSYGERYFVGGVWTTDAPYRETKKKRSLFMDRGAVCVDMEAASLFAISRYRGVEIGALFYAGDLVGEEWDLRMTEDHEKRGRETVEKLLKYSIDALVRI